MSPHVHFVTIRDNLESASTRFVVVPATTHLFEDDPMKYRFKTLAAALFLTAATLPIHAATTTFIASLAALGEPVPTSLATGFATVSFDDVLSQVSVQMSFANIANSSAFGHIHCCTAVANTGNIGVSLGFNTLPAATTGSYTDSFKLNSGAFNTLLTGVSAGKAYVNIHTPGTYSGGEIRGFLAPIPEPETYALMLAGLGVVVWAARRRPV